MMGFARMAWGLAQRRKYCDGFPAPAPRDRPRFMNGPSVEYYRIIDKATAMTAMFADETKRGIPYRVYL